MNKIYVEELGFLLRVRPNVPICCKGIHKDQHQNSNH
jgi:hypothetical protein